MQPTQNFRLRLIALECHITEENDGDEIFLKLKDKKIWPAGSKYQRLIEGDVPIGLEIETTFSSGNVNLELWEYDTFNPNDRLGFFTLLMNEKGGPYKTDLKKANSSFARYTLVWESL